MGAATSGGAPQCGVAAGASKRHVFLLAGQSNMAGRGDLRGPCATLAAAPEARIEVLDATGTWKSPAQHPLHFDKPEKAGVGPGLAFARSVIDVLPPGSRVGLVPCAVGGSEILRWLPPDGDLYLEAVRRTRQGLAADGIGVLSGILWHQGESDSGSVELVACYAERLRSVIAGFRKDLDAREIPMILGELAVHFMDMKQDARFRYAVQVNDSIVATVNGPNAPPAVAVVSARDLEHQGDRLHFTAASADELGRRYAWKWLRLAGHLRVSLPMLLGDSLEPALLSAGDGSGSGGALAATAAKTGERAVLD
eukprot:TRINITY_DN48219_c0_g1_i2.p1 TRINITY_DN48219_c0_g1~~TRINITY_DN48219_c0_g1_i2.p1  ORF type:complete len:329 (-),score=73.61 TRINITY_DN48219_c0_g1_i2:132-1061(-)